MDKVSNRAVVNDGRNLIPFVQYDSKENKRWGYLDEDTGEIIIEAKYKNVYPFVGNYAIVERDSYKKLYIIDKNEKVIRAPRFHGAHLIASESGKNALAILSTTHTRIKLYLGWFTNNSSEFYTEYYDKDFLYNLVTGKKIIPKQHHSLFREIELVGDYFTVKTDLYQFLDNGDVKLVVKDDKEQAAGILRNYLEGRGINAEVKVKDYSSRIEIDYGPYIKAKYANPDFSGAFLGLRPDFKIPFKRAQPFYRNPRRLLNTPLEINDRKYLMEFGSDRTLQYAKGIYNESKAEWEIPPFLTVTINDNGETELFNVVYILQTNNPNLYQLHLKNNSIGWNNRKYVVLGDGVFNVVKNEFMVNLEVYDPPIFPFPLDDKKNTCLPYHGIYYTYNERIRPW
jgi:hypothetical protein